MTLAYAVRSRDQKKGEANKLFVSEDILPQSLAVLQTRALPLGIELVIGKAEKTDFDASFFAAFFNILAKTATSLICPPW
jgi:glycine dehydrogenase